jgi:hypothetical protein
MPTRQQILNLVSVQYGADVSAGLQFITDCGLAWRNSWGAYPNIDPGPKAVVDQWFTESGMQ